MALRKTVPSIIFCFVCFSALLHTGESENQASYDKAQKLIDEYTGDGSLLKRAYKLLENIALTEPNSKYVLVGYGRISAKSGYINNENYRKAYLEQAKLYYEKAILIDPNFFDAYFFGAYAYLFSKDYDKAKQMVDRAKELSPHSAKTYILLGEIAKREKHYNAVIEYAKSAIEKRPDNKTLVDAYSLLSNAHKRLEQYELADHSYQQKINIEPNSPWTRSNYSNFLRKYRKSYDEAIEQGKIALELMEFGMGHKVLADAYYAKGVQLYWTNKQYEESIKYFLLAVEHNPSKSDAWYGLGISYYHIGHKNQNKSQVLQAHEYLERAVQVNPENEQAIELLVSVRNLLNWLEE